MFGKRTELSEPIILFQLQDNQRQRVGGETRIEVFQASNFEGTLEISTEPQREIILSTIFSNIRQCQYKSADCTVRIDIEYQNSMYNFILVFLSLEALNLFMDTYIRCMFELANNKRATADDLPDLNRFKRYACLDNIVEKKRSDEPIFDEKFKEAQKKKDDQGKNTLLRVAPSNNSAFVVRRFGAGSDLGVFDYSSDCTFRGQLPDLKDRSNHKISISDFITNNGGNNLVLLNESNKSSAYNIDMNRPEVIQTYDMVDDSNNLFNIDHVLQRNSIGDGPTFVAFNERDTFHVDPRVSKPIVEKSAYKTLNKFTVGATSASGKFAMGSEKGIVRLYKNPALTRATVNFDINVGDEPVTGLEISPDEKWVVATCPHYVSVFNVEAKSTGKLAFDSPMGKDKPPLTRLSILPEHMQRVAAICGGTLPPFSSATFDARNGRIVSVVASIGPAIVSWDFRNIEDNTLPTYSIALVTGETIVDNRPLRFNDDILFISNNQVATASRKRGRSY